MAKVSERSVASGNLALALVLDSILTDLTNLKSAIDTMKTKLNSDGGVSDTDYAGVTTLETT